MYFKVRQSVERSIFILLLMGMVFPLAGQDTYGQLLQQGQIFFRQKQYEKAAEMYKKAVELDKDRADAHLWLGYLNYYLKKYDDAQQCFADVLEKQPNNLEAHYYAGICDRERARFMDPVRRTFTWNDAEEHFQKIIEIDSTYMEVFNEFAKLELYRENYKKAIELGLRQIHIKPNAINPSLDIFRYYDFYLAYGEKGVFKSFDDTDGVQLEWLRKRHSVYDRFFLGEKYRRLGEFAEADSILSELLQEDLPISKVPVYLSRVRLYYETGRDEEAEKDYWDALKSVRSYHELRFIYDDLKYLMTDADLKTSFPNLNKIQEFYERFWTKRNPFPGAKVNMRLAEHYRRLIKAERDYRWDGVRLLVTDPDISGVLKFPAVYYQNDRLNDKGFIYVRYGPPDQVATFLGDRTASNESWLYYETFMNPRLIFHFEIHEYGEPNAWRLVPAPSNPQMVETRLGWDPQLDAYYMAQTELDRQSALSEVRIESRQMVHEALNKERALSIKNMRTINYTMNIVNFLDDLNENYYEIFIGVPKDNLFGGRNTNDTLQIETGYAVQDTSLHLIQKEYHTKKLLNSDSTYFYNNQLLDVYRTYNDLNTFYVSTHVLDEDTLALGGYRVKIKSNPFSQSDLSVSDLLLAYDIAPTDKVDAFTRNGLRVMPNPSRRFNRDQLVYVYYEIYHLDNQDGLAEYTIDQKVEPQEESKGIFGTIAGLFSASNKKTISISKNYQSSEPRAFEYTAFDFKDWEAGRLRITITVTDKNTGKSAQSSTIFNLQ
ncbi:MAG TPA: tetratricopeptide repeat protein [Caldithrix abyssi]|uniref:Tetratricopeptide repeat protein n=1 Tax=Caldithrix abyssi TaxID=187145 RepID=A0A7V4UEN2_CALAY|nr:tetratricopeptide repeat protein [Caldithrix abyssi]